MVAGAAGPEMGCQVNFFDSNGNDNSPAKNQGSPWQVLSATASFSFNGFVSPGVHHTGAVISKRNLNMLLRDVVRHTIGLLAEAERNADLRDRLRDHTSDSAHGMNKAAERLRAHVVRNKDVILKIRTLDAKETDT